MGDVLALCDGESLVASKKLRLASVQLRSSAQARPQSIWAALCKRALLHLLQSSIGPSAAQHWLLGGARTHVTSALQLRT